MKAKNWLSGMAIGQWYETSVDSFEIIGIDKNAGLVVVQYYDGAIDEITSATWQKLKAVPVAAVKHYLEGHADQCDALDFDEYSPSSLSAREAHEWTAS